jgi:lysophospholipase L1-like esterase
MQKNFIKRLPLACAMAALCAMAGSHTALAASGDAHWVASWGAAPDSDGPALQRQTVRQVVRISAGGEQLRLRLSNAYGKAAMVIGPVHVARSSGGATTEAGSDHVVLFNGHATVTIPKGGDALSDPVNFAVAPLDQLAVSLYVPQSRGPSTLHSDARQDSFLVKGLDAGASHVLANPEKQASRYFLSEVQVKPASGGHALVVVGDSITDGDQSTLGANARWTDALASRLQTDPKLAGVAVVNAGISGNRLLHEGPVGESMLARFGRDALAREGVKWILLEGGLNDIGLADDFPGPGAHATADDVIAGLKQLVAQARAKGIAVWGATCVPYGGAQNPLHHTPAAEAKRLAVNAWIRAPGNFDRIVDFDAAVRDPDQPTRLRPAFDSGDHVHPNDAGYRMLAASVPLAFFSEAPARP